MKKSYIYLAVVVVLFLAVLAGAYKLRHQIKALVSPASAPVTEQVTPPSSPAETPAPVSSPAPQAPVEVDFDGSAFSPSPLTVKAGTSVNFVNKSNSDMWIASNPHPTHTDLPGFDQLSAGSTYSYTFTQVGKWKYHDHLSPSIQGEVDVTQ